MLVHLYFFNARGQIRLELCDVSKKERKTRPYLRRHARSRSRSEISLLNNCTFPNPAERIVLRLNLFPSFDVSFKISPSNVYRIVASGGRGNIPDCFPGSLCRRSRSMSSPKYRGQKFFSSFCLHAFAFHRLYKYRVTSQEARAYIISPRCCISNVGNLLEKTMALSL